MTTEEIQRRVQKIREFAESDGFDGPAHESEDRLHRDFIAYVAELEEHLPVLANKAKAVLQTHEIEFSRWYE